MKRRRWLFLLGIAVMEIFRFTFAPELVHARKTVRVSVRFSTPDIQPVMIGSSVFHRVMLPDALPAGNPGEPELPVKTLKILLPYRTDVDTVSMTFGARARLEGKYFIVPVQKEYPLGKMGTARYTPPDPPAYSRAKFPARETRFFTQNICGFRILVVRVFPVTYAPRTGEVSCLQSMNIAISLKDAPAPDARFTPVVRNVPDDRERVRRLVVNPELLDTYPVLPPDSSRGVILDPDDDYRYVIITSEALRDVSGDYTFQDLLDEKIARGISATIVTTEWIYDNYPGIRPDGGEDLETKIRNFIIDAYNAWGTEYVLLGGDADGGDGTPVVPVRGFYCQANGTTDTNIPSDEYYACLDGSFDFDADGRYGEPCDGPDGGEVDLYAEVFVGRAPVESPEDVSNFVRKTLEYASSQDESLQNALMIGEEIGFGGIARWGGNLKDEVRFGSNAHGYHTEGFIDYFSTIDTLYERDAPGNTWNKNELMNRLNAGIHTLNHLGHANNTSVMKMNGTDVAALENTLPFFGYFQGCYCGAFDNRDPDMNFLEDDAILESLITSSHGAFAVIGNTRYGWGMWYSTNSSSQHFDRQFWDAVFGDRDSGAYAPILNLGRANQDSKEDNIGIIDYSGNRWCYYELTLFGDPETALHLDMLDSDGDGMPDAWEERWGFDAFDPADASMDGDGDGDTNYEEFIQDSNPRHAAGNTEFIVDCGNKSGWEWGTAENPYTRIQQAMDDPDCKDDAVIIVYPGTYPGDIRFNGYRLTLRSLDPSDPDVVAETILQGTGENSVVIFDSGEDEFTVIEGFTIRDGGADLGGGILCMASSPTIRNNVIVSNTATFGGGIECYMGAAPVIRNNHISDNSASVGGGIDCTMSGYVRIVGNIITGNSATGGGGINSDSGILVFNSLVAQNTAEQDAGGIGCYWQCNALLINDTIADNSAGEFGGGIYVSGCTPTMENSIVWDNDAPESAQIHVDSGQFDAEYSCVGDGWPGTGNIDDDPLFLSGPSGYYYLDARYPDSISPCIDAGNDEAENVCFPDSTWTECLDSLTTCIDQELDSQTVNMGFHYRPVSHGGPGATGIIGYVTLQRPGVNPPHASWVVSLDITICSSELDSPIREVVSTDEWGEFFLELSDGVYDIQVKGSHTLSVVVYDVEIRAGQLIDVDFGVLPEGDCDGNNSVQSKDFFILRSSYNKIEGQEGFDERADFNEDRMVLSPDFFLLKSNYNRVGTTCGGD